MNHLVAPLLLILGRFALKVVHRHALLQRRADLAALRRALAQDASHRPVLERAALGRRSGDQRCKTYFTATDDSIEDKSLEFYC